MLPIIDENGTTDKPDLGKEYWSRKRQRQQADQILQSLKNRVQMLEHQEQDLWKRISNNQREANRVLKLKKSYFEEYKEVVKSLLYIQRDLRRQGSVKGLEAAQAMHKEKRVLQKRYKQQLSTASLNENHERFMQVKLHSLHNEKFLLALKNDTSLHNQLVYNSVKEQSVEGQLKTKLRTAQRNHKFRGEYTNRIEQETSQLTEQEKIIQLLEEKEMKMMDRIKNTRTLSQDVETRLQDVKSTSSVNILVKVPEIQKLNQTIKLERTKLRDKHHSVDDSVLGRDTSIYSNVNNEVSTVIERKKKPRKRKQK